MADDDELLDRLRAGVSGIHPRGDALEVVRHQVGRRRRRRRVVTAVASVAATAVAVPAVLVALQLGDGGADDVEPADPTPSAVVDGTRPAAFFVVGAGGRARAQLVRYRAAPGERYHARFLWFPEADGAVPVHAGAAVEQYAGTTDEACADVVAADRAAGATSSCSTVDGVVTRVADGTGPVALDAVNARGRLEDAAVGDAVRSVTVFRDDGWAVSLVLCACTAGQAPDLDEPPLSGDALISVARAEAWVPNP